MECPIQCGNKIKVDLPCNHGMCYSCFLMILKNYPSCPLCRHTFLVSDAIFIIYKHDKLFSYIFEYATYRIYMNRDMDELKKKRRHVFFAFLEKFLNSFGVEDFYFKKMEDVEIINGPLFMDFLSILNRYEPYCSKELVEFLKTVIVNYMVRYREKYITKIGRSLVV